VLEKITPLPEMNPARMILLKGAIRKGQEWLKPISFMASQQLGESVCPVGSTRSVVPFQGQDLTGWVARLEYESRGNYGKRIAQKGRRFPFV